MSKQLFSSMALASACLLSMPANSQVSLPLPAPAAPVTALEYFLKTDPGFGMGVTVPLTSGTDITTALSANLSGLTPGVSRVHVRLRDQAGSWGHTNIHQFYYAAPLGIAVPVSAPVTTMEYFFDTDPGFGMGHSMVLTSGGDVTTEQHLPVGSLSEGLHRLNLRFKDGAGNWGQTIGRTIYVIPTASLPAPAPPSPITKAEYFLNIDPGYGNGIPLPVTAGEEVLPTAFAVDITGLPDGLHQIYVRLQDAAGNWSLSGNHAFSLLVAHVELPAPAPLRPVTMLEYFIGPDPGLGNGTHITVPATTDLTHFSFAADVSGLADGAYTLSVRTLDEWSLSSWRSFTIGLPLPVRLLRFTAQKKQHAVWLQWETGSERDNLGFVIERSRDGVSFDSLGFVAARQQTGSRYEFTDAAPVVGKSFYRLKQMDQDGSFSYAPTLSVSFDQSGNSLQINNPVRDVLHLRLGNGQEGAEVCIYDLAGRHVLRTTVAGRFPQAIDVSALAPGYYLLKLHLPSETMQTPFIKN